jgi:hypothetical protein
MGMRCLAAEDSVLVGIRNEFRKRPKNEYLSEKDWAELEEKSGGRVQPRGSNDGSGMGSNE